VAGKGLVRGEDGVVRCSWCAADELYRVYHDEEWGFPQRADRRLFEKLCLEGFQSGLSWLTILKKRENFRRAFADFEFEKVARFTPRRVAALLQDSGIVRHRGKIESTIHNARRACELVEERGSLAEYFWSFEPARRAGPKLQTETPESKALSKDLKRRGWTYVGPTTMHAFMQAMGLVNDHLQGCAVRRAAEKARALLLVCVIAALGASCASTPDAAPAPHQDPPRQDPPRQDAPPTPQEPQPESPMSFIDPQDGAFDISQFLASRVGFLPIPIIITEPAVGFGGGLGLMFLHDHLGRRDAEGKSLGTPSISGIAGGYTESDTWFAGALHFGSWNHDNLRYLGVVGGAHANLDFFGTGGGDGGASGEESLPFQLDGFGLRQELLARLPDSALFAGLRYEYANTRTNFDTGVPAIDDPTLDTEQAALALVLQYDTRDNILSPNRGMNPRLVFSRYDEALGGDSNYNRIDLDAPIWVPLDEKLIASAHALASFSDTAAPFYALPYITLRGVPALRYQGTSVLSLETELLWNFSGRWSLVGFGGVGQAVDSTSDFGAESDTIVSGGGGVRYLISRVFGLRVGIDIAQGPEDTAVYIQIGN